MNDELRRKILEILDGHRIMTVATLRPDGWPQATTVGYASEGLTLYFLCAPESQKAANITRDNRVSVAIDHDAPQYMDIAGLSMAARASRVTDLGEVQRLMGVIVGKYPPQASLPGPMPAPADVCVFRLEPSVISVLDYSKGFAHTDLVTL